MYYVYVLQYKVKGADKEYSVERDSNLGRTAMTHARKQRSIDWSTSSLNQKCNNSLLVRGNCIWRRSYGYSQATCYYIAELHAAINTQMSQIKRALSIENCQNVFTQVLKSFTSQSQSREV